MVLDIRVIDRIMKTDVLVKEAMRAKPLTCKPLITIKRVAEMMREKRVGSSIVVSEGKPIGIITESDILKKVVAEGRDSRKVKVQEVMTTPLVNVDPYVTIEQAMKIMNKHNIRRLPVIEKGRLQGIITEKDIFRMSPTLLEISREWSIIEGVNASKALGATISGKCEECGKLSSDLIELDGRFLCEDCREQ